MQSNAMLERMQAEQEKAKRTRRKVLVGLLIVLLLAALVVAVIWYFGREKPTTDNGREMSAGLLPGSMAMDLDSLGEDMIRLQINSRPVFADGTSKGDVYIGNPETNVYDMEVVITLEETEEVVYESGLIPPGFYIDNDKLDVVLEDGTYSAVASITYYNTETGGVQTRTSAALLITIGDVDE